LDPLKTILVFSHIHNTFDKKTLLDKPDQMVKLSDKTVDQFIRKPNEQAIKDFFMNKIENLLKDYDPGHPKWKPDVAIQMEQLKKEREEMMKKMQEQQGFPQIMINQPGQPPRPLAPQEIVHLLQEHQIANQKLTEENAHLKSLFQKQVKEMIVLKKRVKELETQISTAPSPPSPPLSTTTETPSTNLPTTPTPPTTTTKTPKTTNYKKIIPPKINPIIILNYFNLWL
jgi:glutaredoxin